MLGSNQNAFGVLSNEDGMSSDPDITVTGDEAEEVETEVSWISIYGYKLFMSF